MSDSSNNSSSVLQEVLFVYSVDIADRDQCKFYTNVEAKIHLNDLKYESIKINIAT